MVNAFGVKLNSEYFAEYELDRFGTESDQLEAKASLFEKLANVYLGVVFGPQQAFNIDSFIDMITEILNEIELVINNYENATLREFTKYNEKWENKPISEANLNFLTNISEINATFTKSIRVQIRKIVGDIRHILDELGHDLDLDTSDIEVNFGVPDLSIYNEPWGFDYVKSIINKLQSLNHPGSAEILEDDKNPIEYLKNLKDYFVKILIGFASMVGSLPFDETAYNSLHELAKRVSLKIDILIDHVNEILYVEEKERFHWEFEEENELEVRASKFLKSAGNLFLGPNIDFDADDVLKIHSAIKSINYGVTELNDWYDNYKKDINRTKKSQMQWLNKTYVKNACEIFKNLVANVSFILQRLSIKGTYIPYKKLFDQFAKFTENPPNSAISSIEQIGNIINNIPHIEQNNVFEIIDSEDENPTQELKKIQDQFDRLLTNLISLSSYIFPSEQTKALEILRNTAYEGFSSIIYKASEVFYLYNKDRFPWNFEEEEAV